MRRGIIAEFPNSERLVRAIEALRHLGYRRLEAFTPYPLIAVEEALRLPPSTLPRPVFVAGLLGATAAYGIQWWTNAVDLPMRVAAFPMHSAPAYVPIVFETTVLFAAFATVITLLAKLRLPRWYDPLFRVPAFERAFVDRFFLAVDATDLCFDPVLTQQHLEPLAPLSVARFGDRP